MRAAIALGLIAALILGLILILDNRIKKHTSIPYLNRHYVHSVRMAKKYNDKNRMLSEYYLEEAQRYDKLLEIAAGDIAKKNETPF